MVMLSLHAKVTCVDQAGGDLVAVLVNLERQLVTDLIVLVRDEQRRVPLASVLEVNEHRVLLRCSRQELEHMDLFARRRFVCMEHPELAAITVLPDVLLQPASSLGAIPKEKQAVEPASAVEMEHPSMEPAPAEAVHETGVVEIEEEYIQEGEQALHRGTCVEATDETLGQIRGLAVNLAEQRLLSLLVQGGGLLRKHEIQVPLVALDHVADETVYLRFDRKTLEQLPLNQGAPFTGDEA
jgi:hypothetical protein